MTKSASEIPSESLLVSGRDIESVAPGDKNPVQGDSAQSSPTSDAAPRRIFLRACHPDSPNSNCSWDVTKSSEKAVEYARADLLTTARKEARAEAFKEAFTTLCSYCADDDQPMFDAEVRWCYHGERRDQVGCSASKLRMLEAAAATQKEGE